MTEPVALTLPRPIHDDIVILQGQEIIRIRELLLTSEVIFQARFEIGGILISNHIKPRLDALKEENEQLRTEHEQALVSDQINHVQNRPLTHAFCYCQKDLEELRAQPQPAAEEPIDEEDKPVRLISPRAAFLNVARLPRYKALQIPAFYLGRSPRRCLKYLKEVGDVCTT